MAPSWHGVAVAHTKIVSGNDFVRTTKPIAKSIECIVHTGINHSDAKALTIEPLIGPGVGRILKNFGRTRSRFEVGEWRGLSRFGMSKVGRHVSTHFRAWHGCHEFAAFKRFTIEG